MTKVYQKILLKDLEDIRDSSEHLVESSGLVEADMVQLRRFQGAAFVLKKLTSKDILVGRLEVQEIETDD